MTVKVGILGFAHGHVYSYIQKWQADSSMGVEVTGAWDHDVSRLNKSASDFSLHPYTEVNELLASGVDAVVVSAETAYHADLVEAAASAGKAIIVQKPLALTISEAQRIITAVNKAGVPFTMAWQMRVDPQNIWMKEKLTSGELGQLFSVRRRHGLGTNHWPGFEETWHVNPSMNRDIWADDSSHPIDFIHWLLGVPESVTSEITSLANPNIPNDNGVAIFRYKDGHIAEVNCSFTCAGAENTTEIYAHNGTIVQNFGDATSCNVPRAEGSIGLKWYSVTDKAWIESGITSPAGHGERIAGLAQPLAEFLNGKRGPICTAEEGLTSLRMVLACYVSSTEGRRVSLSDPKIDLV